MLRRFLLVLIRRIAVAVPILLVVSALLFSILRLLPIDPAAMSVGPGATVADIAAKRREMGLDRPLPEQYAIWLGETLRGDFGTSTHFGRDVGGLVIDALPATIELALGAMLIATVLGVGGGLLLFQVRGTKLEAVGDVGATLTMSLPDFLWSLLLILLLGVLLPVLPFVGRQSAGFSPPHVTGFLLLDTLLIGRLDMLVDVVRHMILPALALGVSAAPPIIRVLRSSLIDVYQEDYIRMARFRGFGEGRILLHHALKNAFLPTLTLMGVQFGFLFGGTLLVEIIFSYPGLGNLTVDAVRNADLPIIQLVGLTYCVLVLATNMLVDGLYVLPESTAQRDMMLARSLRSAKVVVGAILIMLVLAAALFAPVLAPHDPNEQNLLNILTPPLWLDGGDAAFPFGTDSIGRDVLSRLLYGAQSALTVAVLGSLGALAIGGILAHLAGYFGGATDWLIGRAVDVWMSFPPVVLALILMIGLGTGLDKVIYAIILVDWTRFCRVLRSEVLVISRRDYVAAARLVGFSHLRTILKEVLPASTPLLITLISLEMGIAVIVEAIMSFVGMGVTSNQVAWGQMIADSRQDVVQSPWPLVLPMLAIFMTVAAFNLLGDGLRRTLDVRLIESRGS